MRPSTVARIMVSRYRATRTGTSQNPYDYGSEVTQTRNFTSRKRAWEWVAWGWIFIAREQCTEDGRYGRCCEIQSDNELEIVKVAPERRQFCRYHDIDHCRRVVKRLGRLLARWAKIPKLGFCGTPCGHGSNDSFVCAGCSRVLCWCEGQGDDLPDLCNDCALKAREGTA